MNNQNDLVIDQIARCYARLEKIRKLNARLTRSLGRQQTSRLLDERQQAIAELQHGCPHPLLVEVAHDARRGPYCPLRLCEICGMTETAWQFDRLASGRVRPGSRMDCRRIYLELLGGLLPEPLDDHLFL